MTATRARVGDKIDVLHTCEGTGDHVALLTLTRVVALTDGRTCRLEAFRCDGSRISWYAEDGA
ncbi:MAG: hypothetical protein PSX37_01915 [bacterium]|nr:hypothetical protein [bacterium]